MGIRDDLSVRFFKWPAEVELKLSMGDLLEKDVSEDYYISEEKTVKVYKDLKKFGKETSYFVRPMNESWVCKTLDCTRTKIVNINGRLRYLTPKEFFRLQGFVKDEVKLDGISKANSYKLAGNGQSVNVVKLLLAELLKNEVA